MHDNLGCSGVYLAMLINIVSASGREHDQQTDAVCPNTSKENCCWHCLVDPVLLGLGQPSMVLLQW